MFRYHWSNGQTVSLAPGKVVCIGRNYVEHVNELNNEVPQEPLLFIKPATSLCDASQTMTLHQELGDHHFEAELALLIGQPLSRDNIDDYQACIVGLGVALDLTLRDKQSELKAKGLPWEKAKAFDNSCPVSSLVPYTEQNLANLEFTFVRNEQIQQYGNTECMLFPIEKLLREITLYFSLQPGDLVLTGTPKGVGKFSHNDSFELMLLDDTLAKGKVVCSG